MYSRKQARVTLLRSEGWPPEEERRRRRPRARAWRVSSAGGNKEQAPNEPAEATCNRVQGARSENEEDLRKGRNKTLG